MSLEMNSTVVVDMDGTLSDHNHRVHLAQANQWEEYHLGIPEDPPNDDVRALVNLLSLDYYILIVTGRMEYCREMTTRWLIKYGIWADEILMRPNQDYSKAKDLKIRLLEEYFDSKEKVIEEVLVVLEDTDNVVGSLRAYGLNVWQVREGVY
jgi:FMN phosphatase YigB (HAD superfamily)